MKIGIPKEIKPMEMRVADDGSLPLLAPHERGGRPPLTVTEADVKTIARAAGKALQDMVS